MEVLIHYGENRDAAMKLRNDIPVLLHVSEVFAQAKYLNIQMICKIKSTVAFIRRK